MKIKNIIIVCLLCHACSSFAQSDTLAFKQFFYDNGKVSSEGYLRKGKPDGYWRNFDKEGNLVSEGFRKNTKLDSVWKFYTNNVLVTEIFYKNDKKEGISRQYSPTEIVENNYKNDTLHGRSNTYFLTKKIKSTVLYVDGFQEGLQKEYDSVGNIIVAVYFKKGFITSRERINRKDNNGLRQGMWREFWNNDITKWEGNYSNNLKNGVFKSYDSLGNLLTVEKYVEGELITNAPELQPLEVRTDYYPNGKIKTTASYKNGAPEGIRREYDSLGKLRQSYIFKDGVVISMGMINEQGMFQDDVVELYPNGKKKAEGKYKKGLKQGIWKFYYENGKLAQEGNYDKGKYDGEWTWYYDNGEIHIKQAYLNGLADGEMIEYNDTGKIVAQASYIEGMEEGTWFYEIGTERTEGKYHNGMRTGLWKHYQDYSKKILSFQGNFRDDLPHGKHSYYYDNGILMEEGNYVSGDRDGIWRKYDEKGNLYLKVAYKKGNEQRYDNLKTEGFEISKP